MMKSLQRMITGAVTRVIVKSIVDGKIQVSSITGLVDEELDEVERVQNYGLNSWPPDGVQGVMVSVGGDKDLAVIVSADDPLSRFPVKKGETALYSKFGNSVYLNDSGGVAVVGKTYSLKNDSDDLVSLLVDLVDALTKVTTNTAIGPQPFVNLADFAALKAKIEMFKE